MKMKQIRRAGFTLVLLIGAFFLTSFYLARSSVEVKLGDNLFATESMDIGVLGTDGGSEITFRNLGEDDYIEPGMTLVGSFTVVNDSTFDVYYRLRFTDVEGGLADIMQATIRTADGTKLCGPFTVNELTDKGRFGVKELGEGNRIELQLELYFPKETGNAAQNKTLSCKLTADMTQQRNNPDAIFAGD